MHRDTAKTLAKESLVEPATDLDGTTEHPSDVQLAPNPGPSRRFFMPIAAGAFLLCSLLATGVWWQYQSAHIVTRNALVRSHLSELGVRGEGVVARIFVAAGDQVRAGDLLAELDNRHLLARRAQVEASLETLDRRIAVDETALAFATQQAHIALLRAESTYRQVQAEAEAARIQAEDSRAYHATRQALATGGGISAEAIRDAAAKAAQHASLATAAEEAVAGSRSDVEGAILSEQKVKILEGELLVLRAERQETYTELQRIDADIESTRVLAPADGAVIRRLAQPGMAVETGMPLLSLWLTQDTWIEAWIPEEELGDLQAGAQVAVSFPALPDQRFTGSLERIGLVTDFEMPVDYLPQTREARMRPTPQIGVRVRLNALPEQIRPGMSAVVDLTRAGS